MGVFDARDIYRVAMRIEENGSSLYRFAAQIATDEKAKDTFAYLADEEEKHRGTFETFLSKMDPDDLAESYAGEYAAYLHDYVDGKLVFSEEQMKRELASVTDTAAAIEFAIKRELESILYYHEIRRFVPQSQHADIDHIIDEERKHFQTLSAMKKYQR